MTRLNKCMKVRFFPDLGEAVHWKLVVFTDAAHANLNDGVGSTGAYIVYLLSKNINTSRTFSVFEYKFHVS